VYGSISLSKMDRVYIILAGCHGDSNCIYSIFKLSDFIFTILHKSTKKLAAYVAQAANLCSDQDS